MMSLRSSECGTAIAVQLLLVLTIGDDAPAEQWVWDSMEWQLFSLSLSGVMSLHGSECGAAIDWQPCKLLLPGMMPLHSRECGKAID